MNQKSVSVSRVQRREVLARYVRASLFMVFGFVALGLLITLVR